MSAATNRNSSAQPWRAACTLKISSNHKQLADKRHSLTAANNTMTATEKNLEKAFLPAVSLAVFAVNSAFGLEVIK